MDATAMMATAAAAPAAWSPAALRGNGRRAASSSASPAMTGRRLAASRQAARPANVGCRHSGAARAVQAPDKEAQSTGRSMAAQRQQVKDGEIVGLRHTVWDQQNVKPTYPRLDKDESCDVVVVGGGIAGLSVAYHLAKAGKSVVVLEYRAIGAGQTGRTTAHLMPWNDDYYSILGQHFGEDKAALVGDSHRKSIDRVEQIVKEEGINCKFRRIDGYLFAHKDSEDVLKTLRSEYEASKKAGFDVTYEVFDGKDGKMGSMKDAVRFPGTGDFHPLMYLEGLAKAITKYGGRIYEQTKAYEHDATSVTTEDGRKVTAQAVVLATNVPMNHNLGIHARQHMSRSYVVGLKLEKGAVPAKSWWSTNTPYEYIRTEEKDDHDVLVIGGGDHPVGQKPDEYVDTYNVLEKWARARWPMAGERLYAWTGMVCHPTDMLGFYGLNPVDLTGDKTYIATGAVLRPSLLYYQHDSAVNVAAGLTGGSAGDSGEGMTGGTIAGMVISDLILGRPNPWADLYSPSRLPGLGMMTAMQQAEVANTVVQGFKDNLPFLGKDGVTIEDMLPDTGAVVQDGLQSVAVYKDKTGVVSRYTAVCPHLKCVVKWNPNDSTFDCPCHGSLFDTCGRLINGPAKADLAPLD
eukprot:SM000020S06016  [mRNA]  locus=s20:406024:409260:+ [translate_table: standard]